MKRIDLDSFVGEVLELIWLNLRMEPSTGEKEMRYKLVLTIGIFDWYVNCNLPYLSIHRIAVESCHGWGCASPYDFYCFIVLLFCCCVAFESLRSAIKMPLRVCVC